MLGGHLTAQMNLHSGLTDGMLQVPLRAAVLFPARRADRQQDLPAQRLASLMEGHAVPAQRQNPRRLHAGGPADHQHAFRMRGRLADQTPPRVRPRR